MFVYDCSAGEQPHEYNGSALQSCRTEAYKRTFKEYKLEHAEYNRKQSYGDTERSISGNLSELELGKRGCKRMFMALRFMVVYFSTLDL